jgi:hypothetical protein
VGETLAVRERSVSPESDTEFQLMITPDVDSASVIARHLGGRGTIHTQRQILDGKKKQTSGSLMSVG